jgi:hypothetical protein
MTLHNQEGRLWRTAVRINPSVVGRVMPIDAVAMNEGFHDLIVNRPATEDFTDHPSQLVLPRHQEQHRILPGV